MYRAEARVYEDCSPARRVSGAVMVVGGGIGAIQAALDLADSGYYVYMVEKSASIGGVMAQLDKTFPTNDCSMCIMSPKLVEVGRHMNIELLTLTEIEAVSGSAGRFTVEIHQQARHVDMKKCIACGACTHKCPKKTEDGYNQGLVKRKAIYVPYPQAVPLKYAIDPEHCIRLRKGKCGNCEKVCPAGAVSYDDESRNRRLEVGAIILAPGFQPYDPSGNDFTSYGKSPDVVTSVEFERLLSASGPFGGHLVTLSDHREPKKIAWLQCVGSRDPNTCDRAYCSSVCCMYAIKQAVIAKEHAPDVECTIFYMDMRTHGKGFEASFREARDTYGIRFVRCRVHSIHPEIEAGGGLRLDYVEETGGRWVREAFDMAVLSVGMEVSAEARRLADVMEIDLTEGGFCRTGTFNPVETSRRGIFVCGAFQGPKDIPQTVIEAGSAALCAGATLVESRNTLTRAVASPPERSIRGVSPRVGVFVCHCGINIADVIDVEAVAGYAASLPHVAYAGTNMYSCSQDAQDTISNIIRDKALNRIVVAACSPRTHEPLFQQTLLNAGINKHLFEMVNIRNQGSWVHKHTPEAATGKAKDLVRMAVAKATLLEPLEEGILTVDQSALVVGGGVAGMAAARALGDQGFPVHLVERDDRLGGQALNIYMTSKGEKVQAELAGLKRSVETHPNITTHLGARLDRVTGFVGNFETRISTGGDTRTVRHGVTIIATGASEHQPREYLYGRDPRVVTGLELDRLLATRHAEVLDKTGTAVFIQCVGSREPGRPYCSRVCCTHSIANAIHLKEQKPEMDVYILYRDIRTYGEREYLFQKARKRGVIFIRFSLAHKPQVSCEEGTLSVTVEDHVLGRPVRLGADLLVLASGAEPNTDRRLAQFFKVPVDGDNFYAEAHVKLAPSDFATDGVFLCGMAHYPKPIDEAITQAQAAASSATRLLSQKTVRTIGTTALCDPSRCTGCGVCISTCPYKAPYLEEEGPNGGKAAINALLCKGCGLCAASCRSGALRLQGYDESQVFAMISNC